MTTSLQGGKRDRFATNPLTIRGVDFLEAYDQIHQSM
jgi:hypothetical protein